MTRSSPSQSPSRSRSRSSRRQSRSRKYRSRSSRRNENQPKESNDPDRHYRRYDEGDPIYHRNNDHLQRRSRSRERSERRPSHHQGNYYRGNTNNHQSDYYANRLIEREQTSFNIWKTFPSPSPERAPVRTEETKPKQNTRSDRSRSQDSSSSSSSSTSEDDSSKKKKAKKKTKKKSKRKKKHHRKEKKKTKKQRRKRRRSPSSSTSASSASESNRAMTMSEELSAEELLEAAKFKLAVQPHHHHQATDRDHENDDDHDDIGPQPLLDLNPNGSSSEQSLSYGKALLPGEGQAIAQYVQKNMRIPRRGEVGWQGPEIESLETLGYVMSGSRHSRMNAIRIRKENQVYSAEEKRALALINFEEKQQRENTVMGEFRTMLTAKLTKKHGADIVEDAAEEK